MSSIHSTTIDLDKALTMIAQLQQENAGLRQRLISPGWGVPVAGETLHQLRVLCRDGGIAERADAYLCDLDNLKQWNSATGGQLRTDELISPALRHRSGDALVHGQADSGDLFLFVFPAGQGAAAMAMKQELLRQASVTCIERRRYVRGVCHKMYGPEAGDKVYGRYLLGLIAITDHPTMTIRAYPDVCVTDLESIFFRGDDGLFTAKATGHRGETVWA